MKLLLLFLLLFALYTNIVSISIFVKISWRDNGEHGLDYHKYLASKKTGRFHLALNSHYHQNPIIQVTDGYDTYHFNQNEFQSPDNEPSNFNLQIAFNGHDLIIGEINNIEDNSIIYIIPRLDNTKYIKVTKDIVNDYFEQMINLFKHPVRILQFIWNRPMKSDNPIDVRIGCKSEVIKNEATTHSISSLNTKVYRKVDGIDKPYQSTYYVRSRVCPNDQYSVMLLGIHMNEWLYCDHAILSPNYVNTYYVNFYDLPNKPYCKLRVSALKIADKFIDKLSDNEKAVDQRMKDLFPDNIGIVIHGGWTGNKSGFQILSLSSGNVLEKSQQRQLALGRPPTYPKANLMLPSVLAHPQSPSIPVPGTTSTPDFGSTQKKIDIENLPPDELLRKNRLFFKTLKQNSNIGDNSNGINIANQQINDLQQPQPTPILPQHLPHVQNIIAQSYLNPRKENNSQYPRKPPLHVIKQNQPIPSRLGTNQQQIITPTVAQNQQQHTQHDITPIPFSQMDSQNQKQMLQQHVETNNPFHPSSDYNQQTNRSDTGIPPSSIGGENHQQMHQQHHVGTDHPLGLANALNQKQIHQQAHVGTNHPFHLEQHNEDDAIVEKRILEEYEHMPQNVAKKGKGVQHGGDFVGHRDQGSSTPNLPPHPVFDSDFVHDDDLGGLMQILHKHQKQLNKRKNVDQNQEHMQQIQHNSVYVGGEQSDQRFLQNNYVDLEQYESNIGNNPEIHHPHMVNLTSPSNSQQEQHSSEPTLSPQTPIKNPIQLNRDRLFKSPLSNVSTPLEGPAVDSLALSENDPRMTLSAGHLMDHLTPNSHVQPQMSFPQNEGAQLGFHPNPSTLHPFTGNVQQQQMAHPQNQESSGIFGHPQPSNFELNDHHNSFYQNQQSRNLVNPSHLNTESLNLHNTPEAYTSPLPYNFHQGTHGFNNDTREHGMAGPSSQMPHPTHNPNYGSLIQPGQHSFQQSMQPPPPQHYTHSQGIGSSSTRSSVDEHTSSHNEDSSDLLGHFEDYSKQSSLDDIFEKNVVTSQHP